MCVCVCGGGGLGYLDRLYTKHPLTVKYQLLVYMYLANHQKPILKCTLKLYPMPCSIKVVISGNYKNLNKITKI